MPREGKVVAMARSANGLARTKWHCKHHVASGPKYGRRATCNQYRKDLGEILRRLCQWKGVGILEGHLTPGHVHMLVPVPPRAGVSGLVGCLKGESSPLMSDRHANPEREFGNRKFWAEGHCVSTAGLDGATIAKYVREQERADITQDRPGIKEYEDPFARGPRVGR